MLPRPVNGSGRLRTAMWATIEARGLQHERHWLTADVTWQMDRLLGDLPPLIRACEDTQPIILGGDDPDDLTGELDDD